MWCQRMYHVVRGCDERTCNIMIGYVERVCLTIMSIPISTSVAVNRAIAIVVDISMTVSTN